MNQILPTLEEFINLVKNEYLDPEWLVNSEDALMYFNSNEAQNHIKQEYDSVLEMYKNNEIGLDGIRIGYVSRVANCLFLMYE